MVALVQGTNVRTDGSCELSGAGERDRDRLGMPEEDSTAGVVSGTRKSSASCDVTGVGGSTWTFGIALGGMV